jgi:hypothetical protein
MQMIRRGQNPFRVAKETGISRSTLLYHLEKQPDDKFRGGVNPVAMQIYRIAEMYLSKAKLRLAKNIFHGSRKLDAKTSSGVLADLNKYPLQPPVGSHSTKRGAPQAGSADDTFIFREFVYARKQEVSSKPKTSEGSLAEAGPDIIQTSNEALPVDADAARVEE